MSLVPIPGRQAHSEDKKYLASSVLTRHTSISNSTRKAANNNVLIFIVQLPVYYRSARFFTYYENADSSPHPITAAIPYQLVTFHTII